MLDWSRKWQMKFNVEKCNVIHIGGTNRRYRYHVDQKELEVVEEEKDLGVLIQRRKRFKSFTTVHCSL